MQLSNFYQLLSQLRLQILRNCFNNIFEPVKLLVNTVLIWEMFKNTRRQEFNQDCRLSPAI